MYYLCGNSGYLENNCIRKCTCKWRKKSEHIAQSSTEELPLKIDKYIERNLIPIEYNNLQTDIIKEI